MITVHGHGDEALHIQPGLNVLEGPNGCGKTTVLRALAGLQTHNRLRVAGAQRASLATQRPRDGLVGLTVAGEFRFRRRAVPTALSALATRSVATLSEGEARRLSFEVAATSATGMLLLDEPLDGLDQASVSDTVQQIERAAKTRIVVVADHTGRLSAVAAHRVRLGEQSIRDWGTFPQAGDPVLRAAPAALPTGPTTIRTPMLELGTGLHALTGPNGAGKSTLLWALAGAPGLPGVQVDGDAPRPGQDTRLLPEHPWDVLQDDTVQAALQGCEATIQAALVPEDLLERHPLTLSGGEAQRVAAARILGIPARVYLLDEPEARLDGAGCTALGDILRRRILEGSVVLAATHDQALIRAAATEVPVCTP